jgi:hypothetical protein
MCNELNLTLGSFQVQDSAQPEKYFWISFHYPQIMINILTIFFA